jgi:signal transduction histidine kinase
MWLLVALIILNIGLAGLVAFLWFRLARARSYLKRLSRLGHEMRTPLGIMLGVAGNLDTPGLQGADDLQNYSQTLGKQVRRLRLTLDGMMLGATRLSRPGRAGRRRIEPALFLVACPSAARPASTDGSTFSLPTGGQAREGRQTPTALQPLAASLQPVLEYYRAQFIAQEGVVVFFTHGLEDCPVMVDPSDGRVASILDNLLQNALRYGRPSVRPLVRPWQVRCLFRLEAWRLEIIVEDEGPGLRRHPFSGRFSRQDEAIGTRRPAPQAQSSGIGSLVIGEFTRDLGGRLILESPYQPRPWPQAAPTGRTRRRHGSRLTVSLPLSPLPGYTGRQP